MDSLLRDLRLALRRLARERGFTAVAILTLAVGIGANVAIFSVVYGALLQPLAYPHPDRLVSLHETIPQFAQHYPLIPVDTGSFAAWQRAKSFSALAMIEPGSLAMTGQGEPRQVLVDSVSAKMFDVLGVQPRLGRNFTTAEDQPHRNRVVILTDTFWRSQFHGDPGVIGRTVDLDGAPNQIIGVLPASFQFPYGDALGPFLGADGPAPPAMFRPLGLDLAQNPFDSWNYGVFGRLRPGVSAGEARAELQVLTAAALAAAKAPIPRIEVQMTSLRDQMVGQHRLGIWLLLAAVGAILLIVCLNLANLLLVRVHGRSHEIAIRLALGAGRPRLIREVMSEGLILGVAGGALGTLAAWWAVRALVAAAPAGIPRIHEIHLSWPVLLVALSLALLSGSLFSLGPGLRAARNQPQLALRAGGRGASDTAERMRMRQVLAGAQAALSAVLLIVAGWLAASYMRLMSVPAGFQFGHVLTVATGWSAVPDMKRSNQYLDAALQNLRALPGVQAAGLVSTLPLGGTANTQVMGYPHDPRPMVQHPLAERRDISPGYFASMGIPLLRGRDLDQQELAAAALPHPASVAAVISAAVATLMWPGRNPLGQQLVMGGGLLCSVVGVVADVHGDGLQTAPVMTVYTPYTRSMTMQPTYTLLVASSDPDRLAAAARAAIWSAAPNATIPSVETMSAVVAASTASRRFQLWMVLAFAIGAALLAALGIYGVVAYSVERRAGEISLRMTLGAQPRNLAGMVLRQGLTPVVAGSAAGIIVALALGRLLTSLLFGIHASNPAVIVAVAGILLGFGALACVFPVRRALGTDPASVLRQ